MHRRQASAAFLNGRDRQRRREGTGSAEERPGHCAQVVADALQQRAPGGVDSSTQEGVQASCFPLLCNKCGLLPIARV